MSLIQGVQEGAGERAPPVPDGAVVRGSCGTRPPLWLLVRTASWPAIGEAHKLTLLHRFTAAPTHLIQGAAMKQDRQ